MTKGQSVEGKKPSSIPGWVTTGPALNVLVLLLLTCITLFLGHGILHKGFMLYMDGIVHCPQTEMVRYSLSKGIFPPYWSNHWFCGFPLLQFYSPIYFYVTGVIAWLQGSVWFATKAFLFIGFVLSAFGMYLFCRQFTGNTMAGIIAGVAFSLNPSNFNLIMRWLRTTHIAVFIMMPLLWYFFERFYRGKDNLGRAVFYLGTCMGIFVLFQQTYALFCTFIFMTYVVLHVVRIHPFKVQGIIVVLIGLAGMLALLISLFFTLPFVVEGKYTMILSEMTYKGLASFAAQPDHTLLSTLDRASFLKFQRVSYLGITPMVMGIIGCILFLAINRSRRSIVFAIMLALGFFLVYGYETGVYSHIPFIYSQVEIMRLIIYLIFFLAFFIAVGYAEICRLIERRFQGSIWKPLLGALILIVIIGDYAVDRQLHWRSWDEKRNVWDGGIQTQLAKTVEEHWKKDRPPDNDSRFLTLGTNFYLRSDSDDNIITCLTSIPSVYGSFERVPTKQYMQFYLSASDWIISEMEKAKTPGPSLDAFKLLNVTTFLYFFQNVETVRVISTPGLPAIASTEITAFDPGQDLKSQQIVNAMSIDPDQPIAKTLLIDTKTTLDNLTGKSNTPLQFEIISFHQTIKDTELNVRLNREAYIRISHRYWPYLHIRINGQVSPFARSPEDFILIKAPPGESKITIEPYLSRLRKITFFISAAGFLLSVWFFLIPNPLFGRISLLTRKFAQYV